MVFLRRASHGKNVGPVPLVSVIIPAYNRAEYVLQAIWSVLEQTHPRCELILVDDGSTDDTRLVLAPWMDRIRYVFQENQGLSAARNRGLSIVRGDFVAFLDADDFLLPDAFEHGLRCFQDQPSLGAINSAWRLVNQQGEALLDAEPWLKSPRLDLETWILATPFFLGAMLFRQEWVRRVGLFDHQLRQAEDVDYVLRMALSGCKMDWLRRSTVCYRQHDNNMTCNGLEQVRNIEIMWNKFFARSDLDPSIRGIEHQARYYRDIWYAWRLFYTGYPNEVEPYLQRSFTYLPHAPTNATVIEWARMFAGWFQRSGNDPGRYRTMMPFVRQAISLDREKWPDLTDSLILPVNGSDDGQMFNLSSYMGLAPHELISGAQADLVMIPVKSMVPAVEQFWRDVLARKMVPAGNRQDVLGLYLTAFGQAILAGRWDASWSALKRTLQYSISPRAAFVWFRFVRKAFDYFFLSKTRRSHNGG
ncbi:MAG: glycosyltransferase family 2 protein [Anaerolineales bacterium]|nr:glycosyltransferase family 2 protein [Anaerolineales bacterium]